MVRNLTIIFVFLAAGPALAAYPDADEQILRDAKIKRDDESLVKFLGRQCGDDADLAQRDELVRQLGGDTFKERQDAIKRLTAMGAAAVPRLEAAAKAGTAEERKNAKLCLDQIKAVAPPGTPLAAVRLLIKRQSPGAVEALLRFLPYSPDYEVEEEIWYGLDELAEKAKATPPALVAALADKIPTRRAVAACILGHRGTGEQRAGVKKLLAEPDATVRLRAAQGLLAAREKDGIPTLIALLTGTPMDIAWQAEELLRYAAGEGSPAALVGNGDDKQRATCRDAWAESWKASGATLDLADAEREHRRPRLVLLIDAKKPRYLMIGGDGTTRWDSISSDSVEKIAASLSHVARNGMNVPEYLEMVRNPGQYLPKFDQMVQDPRFRGNKRAKTGLYSWPVGDYTHLVRDNYLVVDGDRITEVDPLERVQWYTFIDSKVWGPGSGSFRFTYVYGKTQRMHECLGLVRLGFHAQPPKAYDLAASPDYHLRGLSSESPKIREASRFWFDARVQSWLANDGAISTLRNLDHVILRREDYPKIPIEKRSLTELFRLNRNPDPKTRLAAYLQLLNLHVDSRCLAPYLLERLRDPDLETRREVIRVGSWWYINCEFLIPILTQTLSDPDEKVRSRAQGWLANFGQYARPAVPEMLRLSREKDRGGIVFGFRTIYPDAPAVVSDLLRVFQQRERWRADISHQLGRYPERAAEIVPVLLKAAKEPTVELFDNQPAYMDASICGTLRLLARTSDVALSALGELVADRSLRPSVRKSALEEIDNLGNRARTLLPVLRKSADFPAHLDALRKAIIAEVERGDWQETETELRKAAVERPIPAPKPADKPKEDKPKDLPSGKRPL